MNATEQALTFDCAGEQLVGVVSVPDQPVGPGVLIIVGGPQYRAGSHRQFVHLARRLAAAGFPVMRFDYRGMGDSGGAPRSFEDVSDDIDAAIGALQRMCPSVNQIVLWGLCDGASAALLYADAKRNRIVTGVAIANPWVRSDATLAKAQVKHYYASRIVDLGFWRKLARGRVDVSGAMREATEALRRAGRRRSAAPPAVMSFQQRMASGLIAFNRPVLIVLSGRDLTAREFEDYTRSDLTWRSALARESVETCSIQDADHTFSTDRWRTEVETATVNWLTRRIASNSL